jgi:hypothetical protein
MYLFTTRTRLAGAKFREAIAAGIEITQRVRQISGQNVRMSTPVFSPGAGTLVWGVLVPDLATLEAANDKLMVDDGFNDLVERAQQYAVPGSREDQLSVVVSGEPDPNRPAEYFNSVRTTISAGKIADGMELGTEIAQRAQAITGTPTIFIADATGHYGGVAWISAFANVGELERAQMALNNDTKFTEFIDKKAKGVYAELAPASQVVLRVIPT